MVPDEDERETQASSAGAEVVADLHVHTTVSDGQLTLDALPAAARAAGVEHVAVTDHDRLHPGFDAPVVRREGVTLVRGIELRVDAGDQRVDLLGYGVEPTEALRAELDRIQRNRVERTRAIVECVESRLDVDLGVDLKPGVGRPHVARAIDASDAPLDYQDAFDELIGDDGPCFVARDIPPVGRGVDLLSAACAVVSLAHPFRYPDPEAALSLTDRLDAVERYYPYGRDIDPGRLGRLDDVIAERDLLVTGGSDVHDTGETLGTAGLCEDEYERLEALLSG